MQGLWRGLFWKPIFFLRKANLGLNWECMPPLLLTLKLFWPEMINVSESAALAKDVVWGQEKTACWQGSRGSVLLGQRNNPAVLNKNCRASPQPMGLPVAASHTATLSEGLWFHTCTPSELAYGKDTDPWGEWVSEGDQSFKCPFLPFFSLVLLFGFFLFLKELLCFVHAEGSCN